MTVSGAIATSVTSTTTNSTIVTPTPTTTSETTIIPTAETTSTGTVPVGSQTVVILEPETTMSDTTTAEPIIMTPSPSAEIIPVIKEETLAPVVEVIPTIEEIPTVTEAPVVTAP